MGMMHKLMDFLGLAGEEMETRRSTSTSHEFDYQEDDWFNEEEVFPTSKKSKFNPNHNVVNLQSVKQHTKMMLVEPHTYDETQEMADHLRNRRAIVVNLQRLNLDQAKRVVDFLSGTVYAIGGDIQKLGANIFLCTPDNIEIQGSISEMIQDEIQSRMR
jgi:cell division inhibitor SepF